MRTLDNRSHLAWNRRPKGADIDKPEGYGKKKLRRKMRRVLNRGLDGEGITIEDTSSDEH